MHILHIETGMHCYGGALQVLYLLRGLSGAGLPNTVVCPENSAIAAAAAPYSRVAPVPMAGELDPRFLVGLRRRLVQERPDLVHVHSRRGADWWTLLAAAGSGLPLVVTRRVDNPEARGLAALKYRFFDKVIAISTGVREVLLSRGVPEEKIECIPSAVDGIVFSASRDHAWFRREFGLPDGVTAIGVIAQLIERKGHRYLLNAAPALFRRHPNCRILFFGKGPLATPLQRRCADLGLSDRVIFAGFRHDLPRILPCLDLVVHPATREGLGVSLLQASAAGVPIAASRTGGITDIIVDGETGRLFSPGDSVTLLHAVTRLIGDPGAARAMGKRARQLVLQRFSIDRMVAGYLAVYRQLIRE